MNENIALAIVIIAVVINTVDGADEFMGILGKMVGAIFEEEKEDA